MRFLVSGFLIPSDRTITADVVSESADYCRCVVSRRTQASCALLSPSAHAGRVKQAVPHSAAMNERRRSWHGRRGVHAVLALIKAEPDISRENRWFGREETVEPPYHNTVSTTNFRNIHEIFICKGGVIYRLV